MIIGFINCLLFFFQSLALLETELPVKIAVLNVLQRFSRNSGTFHLTAELVDKFMVYPDAEYPGFPQALDIMENLGNH